MNFNKLYIISAVTVAFVGILLYNIDLNHENTTCSIVWYGCILKSMGFDIPYIIFLSFNITIRYIRYIYRFTKYKPSEPELS